MSSNTFSNLENSKINGNLILTNGYIQFPNGSQQISAGGGGGGDVSTTTINTYTNTSTNNFEASEITCATQDSNDSSYLVANTAFVQTLVETVGILANYNTTIGANGNFQYIDTTIANNNSSFGNACLPSLTTGSLNTCAGANCAFNLTTGSENSLVGINCGQSLTTGSYNSACGHFCLSDSNGSYNTACGFNAGQNDVGLSSNNSYLGSNASQINADTYSYNYLTLIGSYSEPVNVGVNNQIVLGRLNGFDDIYIPSGNIYLGNSIINSTYVIQASGNNSEIHFQTIPSTGLPYTNTLSVASSLTQINSNLSVNGELTIEPTNNLIVNGQSSLNGNVSIPSPYNLTSNNIIFTNQGGDPGYTTNATIYLNTTVTATQQLRCNINGTLYYINLTPV